MIIFKWKTMENLQLSKMLLLATTRHDGQFDKGGAPYILHPLKVMHYLNTDDEELMCIALGHDLLEDTYNSVEEGHLREVLESSRAPGETRLTTLRPINGNESKRPTKIQNHAGLKNHDW